MRTPAKLVYKGGFFLKLRCPLTILERLKCGLVIVALKKHLLLSETLLVPIVFLVVK